MMIIIIIIMIIITSEVGNINTAGDNKTMITKCINTWSGVKLRLLEPKFFLTYFCCPLAVKCPLNVKKKKKKKKSALSYFFSCTHLPYYTVILISQSVSLSVSRVFLTWCLSKPPPRLSCSCPNTRVPLRRQGHSPAKAPRNTA